MVMISTLLPTLHSPVKISLFHLCSPLAYTNIMHWAAQSPSRASISSVTRLLVKTRFIEGGDKGIKDALFPLAMPY